MLMKLWFIQWWENGIKMFQILQIYFFIRAKAITIFTNKAQMKPHIQSIFYYSFFIVSHSQIVV